MKLKIIGLAVLLSGCGLSQHHIYDPQGNYLGTTAIGKETLDGGSVAFTKDTFDQHGRFVDGQLVVGQGLLPAVVHAGGMIGAARVLGRGFPQNVGDEIELSNGQSQSQGQSALIQNSSSSTVTQPKVDEPKHWTPAPKRKW